MRIVLLFVCSVAGADSSVPDSHRQSQPWFERCAERLEAKRRDWALRDPDFASARVRIHKVNDGRDAVDFNMLSGPKTPGFWISVHDQPVHGNPEERMEGVRGWAPMVRTPPLDYPVLLRHLHPRSARMQAERWAASERWQAFVRDWQPLVDACLRD